MKFFGLLFFLSLVGFGSSGHAGFKYGPVPTPTLSYNVVDFESLKGMTSKDGESLDGSVNFIFAEEQKEPAKGAVDKSRSTSGASDHNSVKVCQKMLNVSNAWRLRAV